MPGKNLQLVLEGRLYMGRCVYLQGSPLQVSDLQRALITDAEAVFVLTDKTLPDSMKQQVRCWLGTCLVASAILRGGGWVVGTS